METRTFLFSTDPHLFTIETKIIPLLYSGSYPLTVLSWASAHGRSQLKPQKIGGGPYMENLPECLNYLQASAHPRLPNLTRNGTYTSHQSLYSFWESCQSLSLTEPFKGFMSTSLCRHQKSAKSSPQFGRHAANMHDCFAVTIHKGTLTIGLVPTEISKICWFFLRHEGTIKCRVSTDRHCRSLLEQGELELPCELIFVADDLKLLKKLKKVISTHTY